MVQKQPRCKICKQKMGILTMGDVCFRCISKPKFKLEITGVK